MVSSEFLTRLDDYNKMASAPCQYIHLFRELLSCENEEEAIFKLRRIRISETSYNFKLERLKTLFELNESELEFLSTIYHKYETYFKVNMGKKEEDLDVYVKILTDILNSGYSMYEYCSKYGGFTINEIKIMHKHIYRNYPDIYYEFSKKCMNLSVDFYYSILKVVEQMICGDNFDLFDYYYYTKLSPLDFLEICKKILGKNMLYRVHPIARRIERQYKLFTNIQAEVTGKTIIGSRVLQPEEKFKIAEYLDENYMPDCSYKYALRKYVAGDERLVQYVNQTQKVIK